MLQRVALGQVRFNLPGLSVDGRGVVGGRQLAVRVSSVERLVSFLRVLASEVSLDDLQPGLRIVYARAHAGTREAIVFLPAGLTAGGGSSLGDAVARAARLAGGQAFTGTGRHFVQLRDAAAPLGYDAAAPSHAAGDFILYGLEHEAPYAIDSELPLAKLLLRLSLQRRADAADGWPIEGPLLLVVRRGLGPVVAGALERARGAQARRPAPGAPVLRAWAALVEAQASGAFSSARTLWLFKVEGVPARLRGFLTRTPGIDAYRPVGEHVAVALGYRHPIALEACKSVFPADRLTLFAPGAEAALDVAPRPVLTPLEDVVRLRAPTAAPERRAARGEGRIELAAPLRLEPAAGGGRAVGVLVPWPRVPWLSRLCYALPSSALRGYRVAALERGVLVLAGGALEGIPFGVLLEAAAPDVLVPVGTRLRPAVTPETLAERLGAAAGAVVVFPGIGDGPFRVAAEVFAPLDRAALSRLAQAPEAVSAELPPGPAAVNAAVEIENDPLGPMPLWGLDR
ncbi:MAG TPA: hypothetical protein VHJ20_18190 [Polyangia bacterium]|nr:hypothetical protein [Polyangia bacterium]